MYDFGKADAVLRALNVTSGRHTAAANKQVPPSTSSARASHGDGTSASHMAPQPAAAQTANGHGTATDARGKEDWEGDTSQDVVTATTAAADCGSEAARVATKRLKLHAATEGAPALHMRCVAACLWGRFACVVTDRQDLSRLRLLHLRLLRSVVARLYFTNVCCVCGGGVPNLIFRAAQMAAT